MELLLNVVWLSISLLAFACFGIWARGESDRRRVAIVGVATVCVLTLLFPIISATDDLQTNVAAVEETASVRRIVVASAMQLATAVVASLSFFFPSVVALIVLGIVTENAFALPASPTARVFSLRGPPSVVC